MQTDLDFGDRPRRQFVPRLPEDIRTEAQQMLATWGAFTAEKKKVRGLVALERPLTALEGRQLSALIRKTKIKLIEMDALKVEGDVDWPAHHVEHVIRTMTRLDGDRAENLNNLGWGPEVSSKGHWCAAMLSIDRDRAIAVGRMIVEHYRNQSERVTGWYPLPADWVVSSRPAPTPSSPSPPSPACSSPAPSILASATPSSAPCSRAPSSQRAGPHDRHGPAHRRARGPHFGSGLHTRYRPGGTA